MRPYPNEIEALCKSLKPILGDQADDIWTAYLAEDDKGKKEMEQLLPLLAAKLLNRKVDDQKVRLYPPESPAAQGKYPIGTVVYNGRELYPIGLNDEDFIRQIGIFSITGAGKSNVGMLLALHLLKEGTPWLIIDWKRQYRQMLSLPRDKYPELENVQILTVGRDVAPFKWNPLRGPPNVHFKSWLAIIAEILERSHLSGPGVADFFLKAYDQIAEREGLPNAESGMQPNFFDGLKELETMKAAGREYLWKQSCGRILRSFTYGPLSSCFNARHPVKLEELLNKPVILELDMELPQWMRTFITELILRFIHLWRLGEGETQRHRHTVFLEEVHNLFPKTPFQKGTSSLESVYREIRAFGQGLVSITQHPSLLPVYILGNCGTQITLALQHGEDIEASKKALFLERGEEINLDRTKVGEGIVKVKGRVSPCHVRFPLVPIKIGQVSDDVVRQHVVGYSTDSRPESSKSGVVTVSPPADIILTAEERKLLEDVLRFPLCGVSTRYAKLSLSARQGSALKDALIGKGMVKPVELSTGKARVLLLELTPGGKDYLRVLGHQVPEPNESMEHRFWKGRVAYYYSSRGYAVDVEQYANGRPDIIVSKGEFKAAIEIETGKSDPPANVLKNLAAGFPMVIVAPTSQTAHNLILKQLQAEGLLENPRVQVVPAKAF